MRRARILQSGSSRSGRRKQFFFERKKQETFAYRGCCLDDPPQPGGVANRANACDLDLMTATPDCIWIVM
jgi:hypothetical protein